MDKTKIIAVVTVLVIAIAGISLMFVLNDKGESSYASLDDTGRLAIFGNADNNDYLNNKDIEKIEDIIAGNCEATTFADANQDGVIDQKDIDFVQRMINREEMNIYILQKNSGEFEVKLIKYPLKNTCVAGYEALNVIESINASTNVIALSGASGASFDPMLYSDVFDLPKLGPDVWKLDPELVSNHEDIQAIVTMDSASYVPNQDMFEAAGIDVVRITAANGLTSLSGIVTLGYLFNAEDNANDVIEFFENVLKTIFDKTETMNDADRATSLFVTMSNYVEGPNSDYFKTTELAGSINLADWDQDRKRFMAGDEWLLEEKYQSKYIVHSRSLGLISDSVKLQADWNTNSAYFTGMDAFNEGNYFYLNSALPVVMRIAFMAEEFYPDLFDEGWAASLLQSYYDTFFVNLYDSGYKVNQGSWVVTRADMAPI